MTSFLLLLHLGLWFLHNFFARTVARTWLHINIRWPLWGGIIGICGSVRITIMIVICNTPSVYVWSMICVTILVSSWIWFWKYLLHATICVLWSIQFTHFHHIRIYFYSYWRACASYFFEELRSCWRCKWLMWHMTHTHVHCFPGLLSELTFDCLLVDLCHKYFSSSCFFLVLFS